MRPVGGSFHRATQQPGSLISQVHDRGVVLRTRPLHPHVRYITAFPQDPCLSKDPHVGRYFKRL